MHQFLLSVLACAFACLYSTPIFAMKNLACDMSRPVDVVTIGSTLLDSIYLVSDAFLNDLKLEKGTVCEFTQEQLSFHLMKLTPSIKVLSGGSAANTAKGLGKLQAKTIFLSRSGNDEVAQLAKESISQSNVHLQITEVQGPTAQVTCLITPDSQRSFFFTAGVAGTPAIEDLDASTISSAKIVHHEGYNVRSPAFFRHACQQTKELGALCSLDLGSFALVRANRKLFQTIIQEHVDILFGNIEEMLALYETEASLEQMLLNRSGISVVLRGKKGCAVYVNGKKYKYTTTAISSIDTTGAGDLFIAGFLYGITHNWAVDESAQLGNRLGGEITQWLGGEIPNEAWEHINERYPLLTGV